MELSGRMNILGLSLEFAVHNTSARFGLFFAEGRPAFRFLPTISVNTAHAGGR